MDNPTNNELLDTKNIGGAIPSDLYWEFKSTQARRHESSAKALEIAIRLYCDATAEMSNEDETRGGATYGG